MVGVINVGVDGSIINGVDEICVIHYVNSFVKVIGVISVSQVEKWLWNLFDTSPFQWNDEKIVNKNVIVDTVR